MAAGNSFYSICDNIIVADPEGGTFIHETPKTIFEL